MTNELSTNPSGGVSTWLSPNSFESAMKIADLMAKCGTLPTHLQGKPSDCFRVVIQAAKWQIDPFAVAECTSLVYGRMCFEGKLVAAVLQSMNALDGKLKYEHKGEGQNMSITVTGTPRGGTPVSIAGSVKEWRTITYKKDGSGQVPNGWDKDPFSMLVYRGTRQWTRVYCPEVIMGIYTPDEMEEVKEVEGTVIPEPEKPRRISGKDLSVTIPVPITAEQLAVSDAPVVAVDAHAPNPSEDKRKKINDLVISIKNQYGDISKPSIKAIRERYEVVAGAGIPDGMLTEALKDMERLENDLAEDAGKA